MRQLATAFREQGGLTKVVIGSATAILTAAILGGAGFVGRWLADTSARDEAMLKVSAAPTTTTAFLVSDAVSAVAETRFESDNSSASIDDPLPAPETWPAPENIDGFVEEHGAVYDGHWVRLTLEGAATSTVSITEASAEIVTCETASPAARFERWDGDMGGVDDTSEWHFDLDDHRPVATTYGTGEPFFLSQTLSLKPGETHNVNLWATTTRDCRWRLVLDVVLDGHTASITVDEGGVPFRQSGKNDTVPTYVLEDGSLIKYWPRSNVDISVVPPTTTWEWLNESWVKKTKT